MNLGREKLNSEPTNNDLKQEKITQSTQSNDLNQETYKITQWSEVSKDKFVAVGTVHLILPSGLYRIRNVRGLIFFEKQEIYTDEFIRFSDSTADEILSEISKFWELGKTFSKYGFLHRRGYLLYGAQGGGKTILVQQIIDEIIKKDGIVVWVDTHPLDVIEAIRTFRKIESERKIVVVFEDIDAIIDHYGESEILSFLDGEGNINKILNIATTNYPEKLDKRIIKRPRRFDRVIRVEMPNKKIRKKYFQLKANIKGEELEKWVEETKGFSFAALADLIISIKCFKKSFEDSVKILKEIFESSPNSNEFEKRRPIGFLDSSKKFKKQLEHLEK